MSCEKLFNHLEICTLLYAGNVSEALRVFNDNIKEFLLDSNYKIYLSSLNYGIYHYILLKEKISLHKCCYENQHTILKCTPANIIKTGEQIIISYGYCSEYLIERHSNQHVKKAIHYIHNHLSEPLSLELISKNININTSYLSDLFNKHANCSFSEYILIQRILLSKKLLKSTTLPLSIISERCGFNNVSYFCTCFKKKVGISPCNYRNKEMKRK